MMEQKQRLIAKINIILEENVEANKSVVERVDNFIREATKPSSFNSSNPVNVFETRDENFEKLCMILEDKSTRDPKTLNVYEFYKRLEILQTKKKQ